MWVKAYPAARKYAREEVGDVVLVLHHEHVLGGGEAAGDRTEGRVLRHVGIIPLLPCARW